MCCFWTPPCRSNDDIQVETVLLKKGMYVLCIEALLGFRSFAYSLQSNCTIVYSYGTPICCFKLLSVPCLWRYYHLLFHVLLPVSLYFFPATWRRKERISEMSRLDKLRDGIMSRVQLKNKLFFIQAISEMLWFENTETLVNVQSTNQKIIFLYSQFPKYCGLKIQRHWLMSKVQFKK